MKEKKKKILLGLGVVASLVFQFIGIYAGAEHLRMMSGICIGMGAMCFSLSINGLYRLSYEKEFPELVHQEKVEYQDERNTLIRERAKAKANDVIRWMVIGVAWVNFCLGGALWMSLVLTGVFVLGYLLEWGYVNKFQGEM